MDNRYGFKAYMCVFKDANGNEMSSIGYANNPQYAIENARRELIKNSHSTEWKYVRHQLIRSR